MKNYFLLLFAILFITPFFGQMAITSSTFDQKTKQASGYNPDQLAIGNSYIVKAIDINAQINDQLADVRVTQTIYNPGNRDLEVELFFPLPNDGVIQNFMMMVNGQEIPGELMKKEKAQQIYQSIVSRKRDPALMQYAGYGLFKTSVFPVAVGQEREISVTYTQLCKKKNNSIGFTYPLGTQKFSKTALKKVSFNALIKSNTEIKNIYSPFYTISIDQSSKNLAKISYESSNTLPENDFRFFYSLEDNAVGANVLSYKPEKDKDGYFMLMASPSIDLKLEKITNKNIIFVLDKSGSMQGKKIDQSKKALSFVMKNLNEGDYFNIITYDDRVQLFKAENQLYSSEAKNEAIHYVNQISSGGGTNINAALIKAMKLSRNNAKPNYIIFLTDGIPTSGVKNEMQIAENVLAANTNSARLFAFGVGNDVNARLLDRLTSQIGGLSNYVNPNENIESAVSELYTNISSPVMTDISISFSNTDVRTTYPEKLPDLFSGNQLIWVGKYNKPGKSRLTISGKIAGKLKTFNYDVDFDSFQDNGNNDYIQNLWASRRVGYLIDQIDLNGKQPEWIDELVSLSKEFGILTPYTAYLAKEEMFAAGNDVLIDQSFVELEMLSDNVVGSQANTLRKQKKQLSHLPTVSESTKLNGYVDFEDSMGNSVDVNNIRKIGSKTFYLYNKLWVESTVDVKEITSAVNVQKFSEQYFKISANQQAEFNTYLSENDEIVVRLNGVVYQFNN